jgi:hypothetical protein
LGKFSIGKNSATYVENYVRVEGEKSLMPKSMISYAFRVKAYEILDLGMLLATPRNAFRVKAYEIIDLGTLLAAPNSHVGLWENLRANPIYLNSGLCYKSCTGLGVNSHQNEPL